jgi:DNA helicase-2/ATP-dependent DNA helicase PcrA
MHSAKGLEYDVVFIIGAEEGVFPGLKTMLSPSQLEEERRLCYVAITRAKKRLFITSAASRTLFGNTTYNMLSRFIYDIPNNIISNNINIDNYSTDNKKSGARKTIFPYKKTGQANLPVSIRNFANTQSIKTHNAVDDADYGNGRVYAVGDAVSHKKYGGGIVSKRYRDGGDYIIEILFNGAGMKRFIESMVKLRADGNASADTQT